MPKLRFLLMMLCVLLSVPALASPPTIENPTEPPTVETWHLREVWRLDNDENEELPLMGVISQAVVAADGHVLLLDSQMAHVLEISEDGEFLGTLSRMGQGPGEMEQPKTLFLTTDGKLGLVQVFPGKIVLIDRDNTPGGTITAQGENPMFLGVQEEAGNLVIWSQTMVISDGNGRGGNHHVLGRYTHDGERLQTYFEGQTTSQYDPPVINEAGRWFPVRTWSLAADGSVIIAPDRDQYRLEWLAPNGGMSRVMTRALSPHVRTTKERQKVLDSLRMWGPGGELRPKKTIMDTEPLINRVQVMRDGRIWVRSCYAERDLPEGIHCRYDVYDQEGHFETEVRVAVPVKRKTDYFTLLDDGRFLWSRGARSALNSVYAEIENRDGSDEDEEAEDEDFVVQVILLERER